MRTESTPTWARMKDEALNDRGRLEKIEEFLIHKIPLDQADYAYLNLLISEDQARQSIMISEATIKLTREMVRWSRTLAILTGVLALGALADVLLRIF